MFLGNFLLLLACKADELNQKERNMMSLLNAVSCTFLRANLFVKPSFAYTLRTFHTNLRQRNLQIATWSSVNYSRKSTTLYPTTVSCFKSSKDEEGITNMKEDIVILGIETSCDDTAVGIVRSDGEILSQVVSSQADLLERYGGVAPKMAEEAHSQVIDQVVQQALDEANLTEKDLSAVAVTIGPGLSLCLRVGVRKARQIAGRFTLPMVGVHHMEAHTLVARLIDKELQYPFLALLISGGHNLLVLARDVGNYVQLGTTVDDAIGEAYDKTARWLGLNMRTGGGPALEQLAREGNPQSVKFSVPMRQHKDCNFSYAGLKTQARLAIESKNIDTNTPISSTSLEDRTLRADIAASFQRVAVLHLEEKCERAIDWALKLEPSIKHLVVAGGVASNQYVRTRLCAVAEKNNLKLVCPPPKLCTDNGVMIAWTGIEHFRKGRFDPPPPANDPDDFVYDLRPRWPLGEEHTEGKSDARSMRVARIHPSLTSIMQS